MNQKGKRIPSKSMWKEMNHPMKGNFDKTLDFPSTHIFVMHVGLAFLILTAHFRRAPLCGWMCWHPLQTETASWRAQISHVIGRLCPGSAALTQLPGGCCGGSVCGGIHLTATRVLCSSISHLAFGSTAALIAVPCRLFAFVARGMANRLFTPQVLLYRTI